MSKFNDTISLFAPLGRVRHALAMRIRRKVVNTKGDGMAAVQISKRKKLSGRSYKEWMKSLVEAKGSDTSIQNERLLSQIDVDTTEPNHSGYNGSTNANSSDSPSKPVRLDFQLRRIRDSYDVKRRNSPYLANQTEVQERSILEKFEHPFGEENKSTTPKFVEYWVPVRLSNIQTQQYCGSLFSNSTVLCSSYSWDPNHSVKSLQKILVSTKKCCDHPYLVDWSLHTSLTKGIPQPEQLDAQIKLSSKLLLLLKALMEIKKRGLRVLILYQSLIGSGPINTGDILDDIIHEKFGEDSFVRIDGNVSRSKRRADLKTFNEKKGGKFVCLMETRASILLSINLKSLDTVIFFNSDWDPTNDLKALQKMGLDSQFEQVKVFRLYSAHSVEEKVLMLAKNGTTPEGGVRNKRSTCRKLLAWGAYFLFQKLEDFHAISTTDTDSMDSDGDTFVEEVFQELSVLLPNNDTSDVHTKSSLILEVKQTEGVYSTNMSLVGEAEYPLMDNYSVIEEMLIKEPPYVFWINILDGRTPSWKYFCQSPRTRNSAQSLDDLSEECVRPSKKCRTEAGTTACQTPTSRRWRRLRSSGFANSLDDVPEDCGRPSENCRTETGTTDCQTPTVRRRRRRRNSGSAKSLDDVPEECGRRPKNCMTEGGTTACQTPTIRRRRRQTSGEAAASGMQTSILDKPPSLNLQSQMPLDGHDQLVPSHAEAQTDDHLDSFYEHWTRESPPQNTPRAANTAEDARARETSRATHFEVLGTVCKALQMEVERLENQKTEFSKQHENTKLQTKMAYEKEVNEIHKKYEAMLQNAHTSFLKEQQVLDAQYNKVRVNKALAEALMQRDSNNASLSQVAIKFSVEQAIRLLTQSPKPSAEARAQRVAVAPARAEGGWLKAPAPHLMRARHSPPCAYPEMPLPSEPPRITFSAVSLEQVTSSPPP